MSEIEILKIIDLSIARYAKTHPRPAMVNQSQAAKMLGVSKATITSWVKSGRVTLNNAGMISITEIDRLLEPA